MTAVRKPQRGAFGEPRDSTKSVDKAVEKGGAITMITLERLLTLLTEETDYPHHVEVAITVGGVVKTVDNERDALETVRRLESAPLRAKVVGSAGART
jgi:hypothetical protein